MSKTKKSSNLELRSKKLGEQLDLIQHKLNERLQHLGEEENLLKSEIIPPITQQLFKRKTRYFKVLIIVGAIILIFTSILTIMGVSYTLQVRNMVFNFNADIWNQLFYFGLSIFSIACIFFQFRESNADQLYLHLANSISERSGEICAERAVINERISENTKAINNVKKLRSIIEQHKFK